MPWEGKRKKPRWVFQGLWVISQPQALRVFEGSVQGARVTVEVPTCDSSRNCTGLWSFRESRCGEGRGWRSCRMQELAEKAAEKRHQFKASMAISRCSG